MMKCSDSDTVATSEVIIGCGFWLGIIDADRLTACLRDRVVTVGSKEIKLILRRSERVEHQ